MTPVSACFSRYLTMPTPPRMACSTTWAISLSPRIAGVESVTRYIGLSVMVSDLSFGDMVKTSCCVVSLPKLEAEIDRVTNHTYSNWLPLGRSEKDLLTGTRLRTDYLALSSKNARLVAKVENSQA